MTIDPKDLADKVSAFITKCLGEPQPVDASTKVAVPIIKSVDELKREVVFINAEPNVLDTHGQWYSKETIEKGCENFNVNLEKGNVKANLFHSKNEDGSIAATETFSILKSWVNEVDCIIGEQLVKEGTWLLKCKFNSDILWNMFLEGTVSGVSIGAQGKVGANSD